ncbi:MAG: hypothetical protein V7746_05380 [Halioglobus sp.]
MKADDNKLSTSALARKLEIPSQLLFATLKDYGWIDRQGDNWVLTNKGEFEGGGYQNSRRYGRYIVWPDTLEQHPLVLAIESKQRITAAGMTRYYSRLHPRQINRSLAELGLQQHSILGWELTEFGKRLGGQQEESDNTGAYYVTWPHEVTDHPVVHRELSIQSNQLQGPASLDTSDDDLFTESEASVLKGVDGHILSTTLELSVCDWLYMAQLVHAHRRALPTEELAVADFYIPAGSVYIDCWGADAAAEELTGKLRKRELYRQYKLRHIEINANDASRLDEVLGRGLHAFGIRC